MNQQWIDLHVHSTCSDGTFTPTELVAYALQKGLAALALTDHDTTDGITEAQKAARNTSLQIIPGIELSTGYQGRDIHVLGLNIDPKNEEFQKQLHEFQDTRNRRNHKMIEKMQEHGLSITLEEVEKSYPDSICTRAHFARYLKETGQVSSLAEAFNRYLNDRGPCYVPREKISPQMAVKLIHQGGGKAILAHPLLYRMSDEPLQKLISEMKKAGLDGIEAIYSCNKGKDKSYVRQLARKYGLFITGGSDFHGTNKPNIDLGTGRGNLRIPVELLKNL